jgi:chaperonin GroES
MYFARISIYFIITEEKDMKVKPLADRVMVKLEKNEAKTAGGIIIPDTAQEKTQQGVVVDIGDDKDVIKVKAGQKVMYDKYAGTQIKIDGEEHLIVKMADIIAIVE